jgi:hypothetical protein
VSVPSDKGINEWRAPEPEVEPNPIPAYSVVTVPDGIRLFGARPNRLVLVCSPGQEKAAEEWLANLWKEHPEVVGAIRHLEARL